MPHSATVTPEMRRISSSKTLILGAIRRGHCDAASIARVLGMETTSVFMALRRFRDAGLLEVTGHRLPRGGQARKPSLHGLTPAGVELLDAVGAWIGD